MGKGARSSKKHSEVFRAQQKEQAERQAELRRTRIVATVVAAVLLCVLAALVIRAFVRDTRNSNGYYMRNAVVMSNDAVTLNAAEMSYFLYGQANSFFNSYYSLYRGYYTSQYDSYAAFLKTFTGIDTSVSLKKQMHGSVTWFDYFRDLAEKEVKGYIALCGKAASEGIALSDDALEGIKARAAATDLNAYGSGINVTDVENALKLKTLADVYKFRMIENTDITDGELSGYFNDNYTDYTYIDYLTFTVDFGGENSVADSKDAAKALADGIAAATDRASYIAAVTNIVGEDKIADRMKDIEVTKSAFVGSDAVTKMFDRSFAENSTYLLENVKEDGKSGSYTVYMLLKQPYTDDEKTADVRHILISTYESDEEGRAEAERILALFKATDMTADDFARLALRYSEDITSLAGGGLYERIWKGGDAADAFDQWCFETERQPGDCEVVKTSYGYHVMYFDGYGVGKSMAEAYSDLLNEKFASQLDALKEEYTVTVNAGAYDTIDI